MTKLQALKLIDRAIKYGFVKFTDNSEVYSLSISDGRYGSEIVFRSEDDGNVIGVYADRNRLANLIADVPFSEFFKKG